MAIRFFTLTVFLFANFLSLIAQQQALVPLKKGEKWGFCDTSGQEIIPVIYDHVYMGNRQFGFWHAEVKQNGSVNWINEKGEMIFPYSSIYEITVTKIAPNRWKILLVGNWQRPVASGIVDSTFKYVVPLINGDLYQNYSEWLISDHFEYFNITSIDFVPNSYDWDIADYSPNYLLTQNGLHGIVNPSGKMIVPPQFKWISGISNGKFIGLMKGDSTQYTVYDLDGKVIKPCPFRPVTQGNNGIFVIENRSDSMPLYGYSDMNGKIILPPVYKEVRPFNCAFGLAQRQDDMWELVSKKGKKLAEIPQIDYENIIIYARHFFVKSADGQWVGYDKNLKQFTKWQFNSMPHLVKVQGKPFYRVKMGSDSLLLDFKGKVVGRRPAYDYLEPASAYVMNHEMLYQDPIMPGLWDINKGEKWGMAKARGFWDLDEIISPQFDDEFRWEMQYAVVKRNNKYGVVDTFGSLVFPVEFDCIDLMWDDYDGKICAFRLTKGNETSLVDLDGKIIFPHVVLKDGGWPRIIDKTKGMIQVFRDSLYICDGLGNVVTFDASFKVQGSSKLLNGKRLFEIRKGNTYGVIDNHGKWILPLQERQIKMTSNGKYLLLSHDMEFELMDIQKSEILYRTQNEFIEINDSLIIMFKDPYQKPKFWSNSKKQFDTCPFLTPGWFSDKNIKCSGCNPNGKVIVKKAGKFGVLNSDGTWLLPCEYIYINQISNQYFEVKKDANAPWLRTKSDSMAIPFISQSNPYLYYEYCEDGPKPLPPFDLIDTSGKVILSGYDAFWEIDGVAGYFKNGTLYPVSGKNSDVLTILKKIARIEPINDSYLKVSFYTSSDCVAYYNVEGVIRTDGTPVIPIAYHSLIYLHAINKFGVSEAQGVNSAIFDTEGHQMTGYIFPWLSGVDARLPEIFIVYTGPGEQSFMNWSGKVLGPIK